MSLSKVVWLCDAEPIRRFRAEDAQQDGQSSRQVPGETARYATKQQTAFAHVNQLCLWRLVTFPKADFMWHMPADAIHAQL